jgi:hypothetical protein
MEVKQKVNFFGYFFNVTKKWINNLDAGYCMGSMKMLQFIPRNVISRQTA